MDDEQYEAYLRLVGEDYNNTIHYEQYAAMYKQFGKDIKEALKAVAMPANLRRNINEVINKLTDSQL